MRLLVALCILFLTTDVASAVTCQSSKATNSYWSWRLIEGKRCWYSGKRKLEKHQLQWPRRFTSKDDEKDILSHSIWPAIEDPLLYSIWPEMSDLSLYSTPFDDRFHGEEYILPLKK